MAAVVAVAVCGCEQLDELRGMHRAATPGLHDPPCALVERLERMGGRIVHLHHHAAPAGAEEAQLARALGTVLGMRIVPRSSTISIPRPPVARA